MLPVMKLNQGEIAARTTGGGPRCPKCNSLLVSRLFACGYSHLDRSWDIWCPKDGCGYPEDPSDVEGIQPQDCLNIEGL
jgi:hypothetical protein